MKLITKKIVLASSVCVILFSGCSFKKDQAEKNDANFDKELTRLMKVKQPNELRSDLGIVDRKEAFISFATPKTLSIALSGLSAIDGKVYYLEDGQKDIDMPILPSGFDYKITDYNELKQMIEDLTNYSIKISKNKYLDSRVKKVVLINKLVDFKSMPFQISTTANDDISDALITVMKKSKYNIMYVQNKDNVTESPTAGLEGANIQSGIDYFKNKKIDFYGDNIGDLLDFVAESYDLFLDVYPKKKLIVFSKFKQKNFSLNFGNQRHSGDMSVSGSSESATAGTGGESTAIEIDLYKEFEEAATKIITGKGAAGDANGYVKVLTSGKVVSLATKQNIRSISKLVDDYNKDYTQTFKVTLSFYDLLLNRNNTEGLDLDILGNQIKLLTNFTATPVATLTSAAATSTNYKKSMLGALSKYGAVANVTEYQYHLVNHIPKYRRRTTGEDYFQKTVTVQTGTDASGNPIYKTEPTVNTATEGVEFSIKATAMGENIGLGINASIKGVVEITQKTQGTETVSLVTDSNDDFVSDLILRDGERVIVDTLKINSRTDSYEGVLPLDDFIVGGSIDGKYVRRITVVTAKIIRVKRGLTR